MAAVAAVGGTPCGFSRRGRRVAALALTSLPSAAALDATVANLVAAQQPGLVVAELSTLPIDAKEAARRRLAAAGMTLLDCPLSGTGAQARTRDLAVYASGDEAAYESCREAFAGFARVSHYLGEFGNGSRMKFVANLLVAVHNVAAAEAIVLGQGRSGPGEFSVITSGAGNSRIFELRGPMMAKACTPPTATMHVLQKDSAIISAFAKSLGVDTPMLAAARSVTKLTRRVTARGCRGGAPVLAGGSNDRRPKLCPWRRTCRCSARRSAPRLTGRSRGTAMLTRCRCGSSGCVGATVNSPNRSCLGRGCWRWNRTRRAGGDLGAELCRLGGGAIRHRKAGLILVNINPAYRLSDWNSR